ncbi:MAG: glycoside hydrolase family 2 TIM barrel-domain containing protein [Lachnospiraceae bacterium]|nr:glycoside hydrolase family 2 TIM barrel-domain containing protein [Lachnospiraceae bacterium]
MSFKLKWNDSWLFTKKGELVEENRRVLDAEGCEQVTLPHTWNGKDGQDGGNDYYRGTCWYAKKLQKAECGDAELVYLEFEGANSSADVYVNGKLAAHHDGGYSTFRVNVTELLEEENDILVAVDNGVNDRVYPQMADFTFYGGLYRDVNLLGVSKAHFDLDYYGGPGVEVTPIVKGADAEVNVVSYFTGLGGNETVKYVIKDGDTVIAEAQAPAAEGKADFVIADAHLWNGRKDPFLYTLEAVLLDGEKELDARTVRFGCRFFEIDPERGFILNGKDYPLRGVSRHQDRPDIGNALLPEHHKEDLELIYEVGATTIRLAHYQHNQYLYDLCDEMGFVLWAEIPYISKHMPNGRENTISQMKELIIQNYNHPSIFVWGLSNEITMNGADDPDLIENHRILNDLCHEMDKTRKTTMAIVSMCPMDSEYVQIPDTVSWNHYFGWYGGDTSMNGPWMDKFHAAYPNLPVGMSEYGCEALNWHNSNPEQGDYSEEYQAYYHEELIKQLFTRPYVWATHVWNMFDFAADARAEGGEDGMNHKGLMTFDRKYRKDSFYAYKAWLSDEPFVHICGKRYVDRVEEVTKVTVYSNQPEVELFANGVSLGKQTSDVHFFYFEVPNAGTTELTAKAGDCEDSSRIVKVAEFNNDYRMKETGDVLNWFEITAPEGYFSINDKMGDLMANPQGLKTVMGLLKSIGGGEKKEGGQEGMMNQEAMMQFMAGFTVKRLLSMMGTMGGEGMGKQKMLELNEALNQIAK